LRSGGALVVHSSSFSALFGADKLPVLQSFADWADLALGRCAAIEREREFISNAAHELRTPLTALTGFTAMLARERKQMSEKEINASLDAMVRQGDRARDLVSNLLDMAQIEHGAMQFTPETFDVADVVHDSVESAPTPAGHHVEIHVPSGVRVRTDRARLEQILVNLIANAYRYGGTTIDIAAEVDNAGRVVVKVADDGNGVSAELVPKLFDPFARDVASTGSGSGLGLAICRQLVTALGGSITYEPADSGARFVVTLPEAA
jgi:signal transduction histidine kinase